jgi:5-methyltetrahydrofolate--homocysteine methyltransferase
MHDIVHRFNNEDYPFVELIARAKLTGEARKRLAEKAVDPEALSKGKMLLATVEGESHRHGKDIVSSLSSGFGFDTVDLGMGLPAEKILAAVDQYRPDYLGISASTRATIPQLAELSEKMNKDSGLEDTSIILGGYLALDDEADVVDADHRCPNLMQTIDLLMNLAGTSN